MYENYPFEGYYAFICTDSENSIEKRLKVRDQHVRRLNDLREEGRLLSAGPLLDCNRLSYPIGGLIIAKFNSIEEAQNWIKDEPYLKVGAYKEVAIKAYKDIFADQK